MPPEDKEIFSFEETLKYKEEEIYQYFRDSKYMVGVNIFKEEMDIEKNRKKIFR